jgi:hypothetical protein
LGGVAIVLVLFKVLVNKRKIWTLPIGVAKGIILL